LIQILLIVLCGYSLVSCSSAALPQMEVEAFGAVLLPAKDRVHLRAYSPEIRIELTWEGTSEAKIRLENVAADHVEVNLMYEDEDKVSTFKRQTVTPTVLDLSISNGEGSQVIVISTPQKAGPTVFAVLGDSQGRNETLALMVEEINNTDAEFLVHLGDMVPSGQKDEYSAFLNTMEKLVIPYYTVPGNHDVRDDGGQVYQEFFGPLVHSFLYGEQKYILMDSSAMGVGREQLDWLAATLKEDDTDALLFHHVPLFDPLGKEHAFLDNRMAEEFLEIITAKPWVKGMFTGHIHMFHEEEVEGILFVTSGGGGAPLYATPKEGGFHHYCLVTIHNGTLQVQPYPVNPPQRSLEVMVWGKEGEREFASVELEEMALITREGSFQNIHGNFTAQGMYRGVPVRDLLDKVGGMDPGDELVVYALDGYSQTFSYENIYPEASGWYAYQGDMVLAVEFNGATPPQWQDGYRITFLPEDGLYDNDDCARTSAPGQGWHLYPSAGGRWVKIVVRLEVIPWSQ
jgi:serine/threonine-protein phosphatase CPPED1